MPVNEDERLMRAIMIQVLESDTFKLDAEKLKDQLGVPTNGAATKRWSRFQKKLKDEGVNGPAEKGEGEAKAKVSWTVNPIYHEV